MELRALEDSPIAVDLTPSLPPTAAVLQDRFLSSHCSSCFHKIPQNTPPFTPNSCSTCNDSILYCSPKCRISDSPIHSSSGECRLLSQSPPAMWQETSDIRAALRLLETLGELGTRSRSRGGRIGWFSCADLDAVLGEDERIREGAELMRKVREKEGGRMGQEGEEEKVLWAVMTNAVEVQVSVEGPIGIAVYGPWFSWLNHSCSPNASYRFELNNGGGGDDDDDDDDELEMIRVCPASEEEAPAVVSAS